MPYYTLPRHETGIFAWAWALQERMLALRVLHFGKEEIEFNLIQFHFFERAHP